MIISRCCKGDIRVQSASGFDYYACSVCDFECDTMSVLYFDARMGDDTGREAET